LHRKDTFPKLFTDPCQLFTDPCHNIAGWKNRYGTSDTRLTEVNDGVASLLEVAKRKRAARRKKSHASNEKRAITLTNVTRMRL